MPDTKKIKKSLLVSFWDGIFASATAGFTNDYITPYALALKATTRQIGFLASLPFLASSATQLLSADVVEKMKSRKKPILLFVFIHALMLVPVILIPYIFSGQPVIFLIAFMTLYTAFNTMAGPIWAGLMAEYIPYKKRGHYFGWRNKIMSVVTIASSLAAGLILHFLRSDPLKGFCIIFTLALCARMVSWYFLTRMYEPSLHVVKGSYFSAWDFIKNIRHSNFGRFVLFISGMQFCVNLAAPFFSVFMLKDLKFDYMTYTVIVATVTAVHILTLGRWGRCADKIGNLRVLRFTSLLIASLPLWWIVSQRPWFLILAQVVSGFAWAGFNLCTTNFVYDAVTAQKRIRCLGYLSVCVGLAIFLGGIIGGYLANILPNIFGYKLLSLFLLASVLRFLVVLFFSGRIKEVRRAEDITIKEMILSVAGFRPSNC